MSLITTYVKKIIISEQYMQLFITMSHEYTLHTVTYNECRFTTYL